MTPVQAFAIIITLSAGVSAIGMALAAGDRRLEPSLRITSALTCGACVCCLVLVAGVARGVVVP